MLISFVMSQSTFIKLSLLLPVICYGLPPAISGNNCTQKALINIAKEDQICTTFVIGKIFNFSQGRDICEKCFHNGSLLTQTTLEALDVVSNPKHSLDAYLQYYISSNGTSCNIAKVDTKNRKWTTVDVPCTKLAYIICNHTCDASTFTPINDSTITAAASLWITAAVLCIVALLALVMFIISKQRRCRKYVGTESQAELQPVGAHATHVEDADGNANVGSKTFLPTNRQYEKELEIVERQINDRKLSARRLVGTEDDAVCQICQKTKFADGVGIKCYYCQLRCCLRCGGRMHIKTKVVRACALCQKRQQIIDKIGKWFNKDTCGPTTPINLSPSIFSMPTSSGPPFSIISSITGSGSLAAEPQPPSIFQQGDCALNQNQSLAPPSKAGNVPTGDHQSPQGKPQATQLMSKHQTEAVQKHSQRQQALQQHVSTDVCK